MGNNSHKPAIRFQGFTDAWEQRKLGDISDIKTGPFGSTLHADDYVDDGVPIITTEHFKTGLLQQEKTGLPKVSDDDYKRLSSYTLRNGDIVFSRVGSVDINAQITLFQDGWLFSGRVLRVRPSEEYSSSYLHAVLDTEIVKNDIRSRAVGQTMPSINTEILKVTELMVSTSLDEQKQIGEFLTKLDETITLHQRKYEKLITVKKSMLEKMFPRDGSNNPEIRFTGFTDRWEQRKLGELAEIKDSARIPNNEWSNSGVPYIRASDITNEDISGVLFISSESYDYYKARTGAPAQGDVLFNGGGEIGKAFLNTENTPIYVQGGAVLYVRTSKSTLLDGQYLKTFFETPMAQCYIDIASAGGTMKHFTLKPSQEMPIQLPEMREQIQIGRCFRNIDNLITLHHLKLEKLKNIKQSLLQNMFV